jgi:hypothetical protein
MGLKLSKLTAQNNTLKQWTIMSHSSPLISTRVEFLPLNQAVFQIKANAK